jgi:hypothetical protein
MENGLEHCLCLFVSMYRVGSCFNFGESRLRRSPDMWMPPYIKPWIGLGPWRWLPPSAAHNDRLLYLRFVPVGSVITHAVIQINQLNIETFAPG